MSEQTPKSTEASKAELDDLRARTYGAADTAFKMGFDERYIDRDTRTQNVRLGPLSQYPTPSPSYEAFVVVAADLDLRRVMNARVEIVDTLGQDKTDVLMVDFDNNAVTYRYKAGDPAEVSHSPKADLLHLETGISEGIKLIIK